MITRRLFRHGVGRLTAPQLSACTLAAELVSNHQHALEAVAARHTSARPFPAFLLGEITAASTLPGATNRWEYSWRQVGIDAALGVSIVSGGHDNTTLGKALNLCEMVNDGAAIEGPGWNLATAPVGFVLQPIQKVVAQLWPWSLDDGSCRLVFFASNVLDGECPEQE